MPRRAQAGRDSRVAGAAVDYDARRLIGAARAALHPAARRPSFAQSAMALAACLAGLTISSSNGSLPA